jgi:hypothetical protein
LLNASYINPHLVIDRKENISTGGRGLLERRDASDTVVARATRAPVERAWGDDERMSTRPYEYNLPETAICPGCETMVVLPVVVSEDGSLPICGTCGSEVPDPRIAVVAAAAEAEAQQPPENRKYTRGSLLGALRDTVADKGIAALNKRVPPNFRS